MSTKVDFDWSPKSVPLSWTIGGNTYPYAHQADAATRTSDSRYAAFTTPTNLLITFVATAIPDSGVIVTEYKWDFGDGQIGYGATATHTYLAASPQTQVVLTITDSRGDRTSRGQILNLRAAVPILVASGISVGP
jgi:chitodextrinase